MLNTISTLMSNKTSLKVDQDERTGGASMNGVPVLILGGNSWKIGINVDEITPEIHKALSSTLYTGETMKKENDILMLNYILRDVKYTSEGDRPSNRKNFFTELPKRVNEIQNKTFKEIDLDGQGLKIFIPSIIIDFYTRLEILLGLKLSGHTDTLTEATKIIRPY